MFIPKANNISKQPVWERKTSMEKSHN